MRAASSSRPKSKQTSKSEHRLRVVTCVCGLELPMRSPAQSAGRIYHWDIDCICGRVVTVMIDVEPVPPGVTRPNDGEE